MPRPPAVRHQGEWPHIAPWIDLTLSQALLGETRLKREGSPQGEIELPVSFIIRRAVFRVTTPIVERFQYVIAATQAGPNGVIHVEPDLVLALAGTIRLAAKMWQVRDPNDAVEWQMLIINEDDR